MILNKYNTFPKIQYNDAINNERITFNTEYSVKRHINYSSCFNLPELDNIYTQDNLNSYTEYKT